LDFLHNLQTTKKHTGPALTLHTPKTMMHMALSSHMDAGNLIVGQRNYLRRNKKSIHN
jgi:hypothetical protein